MSSCLLCPSFIIGGNRVSRAANKKAVVAVAAVVLSFYVVGRIFCGANVDSHEKYVNPAEKQLSAFFEDEEESEIIAEEINYEVQKISAFDTGDTASGETVTETTEIITVKVFYTIP